MVAVTVTTLKQATHPLKKRLKDWADICMSFFITIRNKYRVNNDKLKRTNGIILYFEFRYSNMWIQHRNKLVQVMVIHNYFT